MAVPLRKDVYLEALEEVEDEDSESMQVWEYPLKQPTKQETAGEGIGGQATS